MSVATKRGTLPSLNFSSALVLAPWLLFPCIAKASIPALSSCFTSLLAPCFVRVNTMPFLTLFSFIILTISFLLSSFRTNKIDCSILSTVISFGLKSTIWASLRNEFAKFAIEVGIVALKSKFCLFLGSIFNIFLISLMNPMSSILSASSNIKNSTLLRWMCPCCIKSSSLPGVATNTSIPFLNDCTCGF